jgi:hypothetical protein
MWQYLTAILFIMGLFILWLSVQALARRYAARHPEFGAAREEGGGCGSGCSCAHKDHCSR